MNNESQYLLAVYVAAQRGSSPAPGDVANLLNRSPASVTEMYKRLADRDLLEYESHQGGGTDGNWLQARA